MDQGKISSGTGVPKPGASRPAETQQVSEKSLLSRCLGSAGGNLLLNIPGQILPDFLVEANEAVYSKRLDRAAELLSDQNTEAARRRAAERPAHANVIYLMLGIISQKLGRSTDALAWYEKILETEQNALVANEMANIYQKIGRYTGVLEYRRKAMEAEPDNTGIWSNYAVDLIVLGKAEEGIELLRRAADRNPSNEALHSNVLWYTHYLPDHDPHALFEEHRRWGQIHTPPSMARRTHANDPEPNRRLRVGYLCPDFRSHPTADTFDQFLNGHNRDIVEVYGYGNVAIPDHVTERLTAKFDHYRHVYGTSDEDLAALIEQDKIDILVEIGGRVANNRLVAMAYKPAPIQVDCGGINTTGMEQIDYRLTDSLLSPPGSQELSVEELAYLPGGLYCFSPPDHAPPVAPLPAERNGHVTFGSFNGALKTNAYIVSIWAEVLRANQGSRFLMKIGGGNDRLLRNYYLDMFDRFGIARERVDIHNWKSPLEHLRLYGEVDIVLDTYPVNGAMTMLEGLWMGVPPISLVGKHGFLSRTGLSILSRIGMEFFAVSTPQEYVAKATALARNLPALAKIRTTMRQRMSSSPLLDAKSFARGLENVYRKMWHRWCRTQGAQMEGQVCGVTVGENSQPEITSADTTRREL